MPRIATRLGRPYRGAAFDKARARVSREINKFLLEHGGKPSEVLNSLTDSIQEVLYELKEANATASVRTPWKRVQKKVERYAEALHEDGL